MSLSFIKINILVFYFLIIKSVRYGFENFSDEEDYLTNKNSSSLILNNTNKYKNKKLSSKTSYLGTDCSKNSNFRSHPKKKEIFVNPEENSIKENKQYFIKKFLDSLSSKIKKENCTNISTENKDDDLNKCNDYKEIKIVQKNDFITKIQKYLQEQYKDLDNLLLLFCNIIYNFMPDEVFGYLIFTFIVFKFIKSKFRIFNKIYPYFLSFYLSFLVFGIFTQFGYTAYLSFYYLINFYKNNYTFNQENFKTLIILIFNFLKGNSFIVLMIFLVYSFESKIKVVKSKIRRIPILVLLSYIVYKSKYGSFINLIFGADSYNSFIDFFIDDLNLFGSGVFNFVTKWISSIFAIINMIVLYVIMNFFMYVIIPFQKSK